MTWQVCVIWHCGDGANDVNDNGDALRRLPRGELAQHGIGSLGNHFVSNGDEAPDASLSVQRLQSG